MTKPNPQTTEEAYEANTTDKPATIYHHDIKNDNFFELWLKGHKGPLLQFDPKNKQLAQEVAREINRVWMEAKNEAIIITVIFNFMN